MNSSREILKRLLRSYPVAALKGDFESADLKQGDLIDWIATNKSQAVVKDYCKDNFDLTKQHVYCFSVDDPITFKIELLGQSADYEFDKKARDVSYVYFVPVTYSVFNLDKKAEEELKFLCPVKVTIKGSTVLLRVSLLERNADAYYADKVVTLDKTNDEAAIVESFEQFVRSKGIELDRIDLTKGIKELLRKDIVDFSSVKFRKSRSVTTEAMDEAYTVKKQYPDVYKEIMKGPLDRTICKFLEPKKYMSHFRVEPEIGRLAFSIYPSTTAVYGTIIKLILDNN